MLPACAGGLHIYPTNSSPDFAINFITIIKTIITRGSSLDRDLEGFPLNQVEADQRGHNDYKEDLDIDGDVFLVEDEAGLHYAFTDEPAYYR